MNDISNEANVDAFLSHYGVKGQRWGVRNERKPAGTDRKQDRQDTQAIGKRAGEIIREGQRAETPSARRAAADKYKTEVLDVIKSPDFKNAYNNANKVTKGTMATHVLLFGVLAPITIKAAKNAEKAGYDMELDMAHEVFRELRRTN